jgi:hypothetical protein
MCRKPEILADAAWWILTSEAKSTTGQFFIDDELLQKHGVHDLDAALRLLLVHEEAGSEVMLSTDVSSCLGCSRRVY